MVKDNEDGTKQYAVTSADKVDLRKKIFEILPKQKRGNVMFPKN